MSRKLTGGQIVTLEDAAVNAGIEDGLRTGYSGRGMYGKTCIAIVGSASDLQHFVLNVADSDPELADELAVVAVDDMGLDKIFYWPGLQTGDETT